MNDYRNNDRPGDDRPSVAEIAALTRRLRDLSVPGRTVNPAERAAFLADKDALIARITDTDATTDAAQERHHHIARTGHTDQTAESDWWARAESPDPTVEPVTFDAADYNSDAHLDAIAHARAAGDTERAEPLQDAHWTSAADEVPVMPDWMREQARRTESEIADGTYVASPPDDLARFADRLAALREQTDPDAADRRDQLARWHHDDAAADAESITDCGDAIDIDGNTPGWDR